MTDWVSLIEASYDLAPSREDWLARLAETTAPLLDLGLGVTALVFHLGPTQFRVEDVAVQGAPELNEMARASNEQSSPEGLDRIYRSGIPAGTLSEVLFPYVPGSAEYFAEVNGGRLKDAYGIVAHTGTGWGVALTAPLPERRGMTRVERRQWTRAAAHVAAGLRLRQAATQHTGDGDTDDATEAVFDPDGRVLDALGPARRDRPLARLREAVRRTEEARRDIRRRDPARAQELWEGLVAGRWSLVDRFDASGRRHIAAVRNAPRIDDPRGLTQRERQVAEFFGLGRSPKQIAYLLGLSPSTVSAALDRVQRKLGLGSRPDVATFFSPTGLRARLTEVPWQGETLLVGSVPVVDESALADLSDAERAVALALLSGSTLATIAADREVSERTVANQVQAIHRKLRVRSTVELALKVSADGAKRSSPT